ncbi:hypothetical protein K503DRAFT_269208 [Rhizopogon vinicolor AM-OR11-026]|uniref:Uncharacterized protein n=1 Tax=Rhizopogon vinicolor AM-OR11-026 TaxID=1314800 RepID=A0A1B7MWC1_9AGAM|nr:hypothetical protein K503DRAFT_269208 [Rhizopogon vinicolor AM-OR11-026]
MCRYHVISFSLNETAILLMLNHKFTTVECWNIPQTRTPRSISFTVSLDLLYRLQCLYAPCTITPLIDTMRPAQFACLFIVAAVGMANPLMGIESRACKYVCLAECIPTMAEAQSHCPSNPIYTIPRQWQDTDACFTCCHCDH